jgi:ABC-2 type transport system permease protein
VRKLWVVTRREFLERVRTRQFIIGTLLGPVLFGLLFTVPILLLRSTGPKRIALVDATTDGLGERLEVALASELLDESRGIPRYYVTRVVVTGNIAGARDSMVSRIDRRELGDRALDGVLVLTDSVLVTDTIQYLGANAGSPSEMEALTRSVQQVLLGEKLLRSGVDPSVLASVARRVQVRAARVARGEVTGQSGEASFLLAYVMSFVLYFALAFYGLQVVTSTVEEKTSRINEVLVSSLSPFQLLLGKVVGVGSVGLVQLGIWAGAAFLLASQRSAIAAMLGANPDAVAAIPIPDITLDLLVVFLLFFILGFFFYSAGYAAVGSSCSTMQEAQQAAMPFTLLILVGFFLMFRLVGDPNGQLARIMSLVPPFAPFITPVRHSLSPLSAAEVVVSLAAMVVGLLAMAWVAGRIYRVGILMYGKRASFLELVGWVRVK